MLAIVLPVFAVILCGYLFGRRRAQDRGAARLLNDYVLYIALPALLFLALARADAAELRQWGFMGATLAGIAAAFLAGTLIVRLLARRTLPRSSIAGMAASYGTTGYMGVPLLIAAYGPGAAVPAAIATILHNIPVIMGVIVIHDVLQGRGNGETGLARAALRAARTTFTNPLTVAVAAGALTAGLGLALPGPVETFARFLGAAAGPTALFALGLGLAGLDLSAMRRPGMLAEILPLVMVKIVLQPLVTYLVGRHLIGMEPRDVWFAAAVVMAAQPIGAGVYVFAAKYEHFEEETSLAIVVSLVLTVASLAWLLGALGP